MLERLKSIFVDVEEVLKGWTYPKEDIDNLLLEKSDIIHDHDDNYYTKVESDAKLLYKTDDSSLSTVAKTGSYNDLTDTPHIPREVSELDNDNGYLTNDDSYLKSETFSKVETRQLIAEALSKIEFIKVVTELPIFDIETGKLYFVPNTENKNIKNKFDVYTYIDDRWEHLEALEFNISDYPTISEVNTWLSEKANISHAHGNITNDGKIGSVTGKIITTGANGVLQASNTISANTIVDSASYNIIGNSSNASQNSINNLINTRLSELSTNKANTTHSHTVSQITDLNTVAIIVSYDDETTETINVYGE